MRGRKLDDESRIESEEVRDGRSAYKKNKMNDCDDGRVMVDVIAFQL